MRTVGFSLPRLLHGRELAKAASREWLVDRKSIRQSLSEAAGTHFSRHISTASMARRPVSTPEQGTYDGLPKILVFGGNGYVGSRVCEQALTTGLQVVSISRSGQPKQNDLWVNEVEWFKADVFDTSQWKSQLQGAIGVVSCLGGFGSNEFMYKICGESNATVFREAAKAGVARAAFISVADYKVPEAVLRGYWTGKRYAERVLAESFPEGGVALRPTFIYGTRNVAGLGIPLTPVGWPLAKVVNYIPQAKDLSKYPGLALGLLPPVSVEAVAKAAVAAATDPVVKPGILDCWEIQKFEES